MTRTKFSKRRASVRLLALFTVAAIAVLVGSGSSATVSARDGYQRISGEGSSWAANAIDAMRVNVRQFGITVDYNPSGSTSGRKNFLNGTVDFAASDIPFQFTPEDGSAPENPAPGSYAYMPVVAGGTAFIYNLVINGQRVTNLRLSGENITKIFTGAITAWNDPALQADNPGIVLPGRPVVPVVRSDGSGSSAQFTTWMIAKHGDLWNAFCEPIRGSACGFTSFYPTISGMIAQNGDVGVAGYVSQSFAEGAIGYVNYSYALSVQFPVVKVLNAAGYYTEPTPENVAVSLLQARINEDASNPAVYLTQQLDGVYSDADPRNYQLSSYSYFILPTTIAGQFNEAKGYTLGAFAYYAMCQAQQQSASLGYSPMPVNLVEASFNQIRKIPGVVVQDIDITTCKNPTFSADGSNLLADHAPQPQACDKQGPLQCPDGTGGMTGTPTATANPTSGGGGGGGGGVTSDTVAAAAAGAGSADAGTDAGTGGDAGSGAAAGSGTGTGSGTGSAAGSGTGSGSATDSGTGTGTGTGSGTDTATAGDAVTPVCDADTGECVTNADAATTAGDGAQSANGPALGAVKPSTLKPGGRWGTAIPMILVVLFTLALVLAPAAAWRYFSGKSVPTRSSV
jgi:ABC-type phosphate transport system substrate-binding protein